jgi:hypothetical protein
MSLYSNSAQTNFVPSLEVGNFRVFGSNNCGQQTAALSFDPRSNSIAPITVNGCSTKITVTLITNTLTAGSVSGPITILNSDVSASSIVFGKAAQYSAIPPNFQSGLMTLIGEPECYCQSVSDGQLVFQIINNGYNDMLVGETFTISIFLC